MNTLKMYMSSAKELKKARTIAACALLGALSIILGYWTIQVGDFLKIGFSSLTNEAVAFLFGPVVAPVFGGTMDIVKYFSNPKGPFFPGFTMTAVLAGLINGTMLYRKEIRLWRVFVTKLIVIVVCDIILNTFWLTILYGQGYAAILPMRVLKNAIMWPIQSIAMYIMLRTMKETGIVKDFLG